MNRLLIGLNCRYHKERDGKTCKLIIKQCRPDDECEYACGLDERRSRARLFVEGEHILLDVSGVNT